MNNDIKEILISREQIDAKCIELAAQISEDYKDKKPLLIGFLRGCVPFLAKLMDHTEIDLEYDFMDISTYFGGTTQSDTYKILKDLDSDITGRHVLIVEDIVDTGTTLNIVLPDLLSKKPASLEIITLLDKPSKRKHNITPKYIGFEIPDLFVVGFGLDYKQLYRNLPYVGLLKDHVYK